jgi:hypothetical protein
MLLFSPVSIVAALCTSSVEREASPTAISYRTIGLRLPFLWADKTLFYVAVTVVPEIY